MADQPINDKDNIKNAVPSKWTKGACPPIWQEGLWNDSEPWADLEPWED